MKLLESQVGGHLNILAHEDDTMIFKPLIETEKIFYETALNFEEILPFIPKFMGVLERGNSKVQSALEDGCMKEEDLNTLKDEIQTKDARKDGTDSYICLENLLQGYVQPNILDLKIGTILHDHLASEEKKRRMIKRALETTSHSLGLRVTGMKVYNPITQKYDIFPREFGVKLTEHTFEETFEKYVPTHLPKELKKYLINAFLGELEEIENCLTKLSLEMAASSLLFIYEGEPSILKKSILEYNNWIQNKEDKEEDSEEEEEEEEEIVPPFKLKLIDFAHSFWKEEGYKPHPGWMFGIKNAKKFLKLRAEKV